MAQLRLFDDKDPRSKQGHGSRACYIKGCRETLCRLANAQYQADYRAGRRGRNDNRLGGYRARTPGQE